MGLKWKDSIQTKDGDWAYANNPWLASVTVRSKPKQYINYLSLPRMHKNQSQWNDEMISRQVNKKPLVQKEDPPWLKDQLPFHLRNYRAHQDFRKMSIGAVILIGSPVIVASLAGTSTGSILFNTIKTTLTPKLQFNLAGGVADWFNQAVILDKSWGDINYGTVISNTLLGGRNLIGSTIFESSGSFVTLSLNDVSFNLNSEGASQFSTGAVGNLFGNGTMKFFEFGGVSATSFAAQQTLNLPGEFFGNLISNGLEKK